MSEGRLSVVALAGPNGAGKSTAGPALLREALGITEFVNADVIAQGLSAFEPEGVAFAAGRIMLARLEELARRRATFAFETTLAGRAYAPWLEGLLGEGYRFHLVFLWLPSPEFAIQRVQDRVRRGGHQIPENVVRRRYFAGLRNFFTLYQRLAESWRVYDNSSGPAPRLIAAGQRSRVTSLVDAAIWSDIQRAGEA